MHRSCIHVNELTVTEKTSDHTEQLVSNCIHKDSTFFKATQKKGYKH